MLNCIRKVKNSQKTYEVLTASANGRMEKAFKALPFTDRIVLVPQCMRNIEKCKAKEMASHYICLECNACKIAPISKTSKELGYKALYILKGGRAIEKIIKEKKPKGIMAVACYFEGAEGIKLLNGYEVQIQFIPLLKDGCENTDVDLNEVFRMLRSSQCSKVTKK